MRFYLRVLFLFDMLKNIILFLLFVFVTQTVLAGIDLHNGSDNDNSFDIIEHYIDAHHCDIDSIKDNVKHSVDQQYEQHNEQHSCHGHMTPFSFIEFSIFTSNYSHFSSTFSYLFNDYSAIVSPADRPPIAS